MVMFPVMVRQVVLRQDIKSKGKFNYRYRLFPDRDGPFPEPYELEWS